LRAFIISVVCTIAATSVISGVAQGPPASGPNGVWEGVIEDAKRPIVVLAADFDSRTAKLDVAGSATLPLEILSNEAGRFRFQVNVGTYVFQFEGQQREAEIQGTVRIGDEQLAFRLQRLLELPAPRDRAEAWQQDLEVLVTRFLKYDRSFSAQSRAAFRDRIAALQGTLRTKTDPEIIVEMARTIALSGNAHTRLYLMRNRTEVRRLPIRVWWFKDRLHIIRAVDEQKNLLGCRILKIGAMDVTAATARIRGIKAGNNSWQRYMSSYFLTSPDVLFGAGVIPSPEQVALRVSCGNTSRDVRLVPLPLRKASAPVEAWWDLAPAYGDLNASLVPALQPKNAPRYLQKPQENYWFEYIPESRAIYVQYNRSQEMRNGMSMEQFKDSLLQAIEERKPDALIFDLRFNTGGNLEVGTPLMKALAEKLNGVPVFVLTGRATFSAGITHVVQLKQWARATIAGEPVGDELDMWAEGGNLLLPNSKLTAHYSNGFHSYSKREYPDRRPYLMDLDVDSVAPDIVVEPSWSDYIQGKDAVLDAVAKRIRRTRR
jgi:hypothetical protein